MTDAARPATHADSSSTLSYEQAGVNYELIDPLKVSAQRAAAERDLKAMCEKLLANTVIETYRVDVLS